MDLVITFWKFQCHIHGVCFFEFCFFFINIRRPSFTVRNGKYQCFCVRKRDFSIDLIIANFYIGQNFFAKFAGLAVDLCHWLAVDLEAVETVDSRIFKSQSYRVSAFLAVSGIAEEIMLATVCIVLICKNLDRFLEETSSDLDRSFLTLLPVTPVAVFFQQFVLLVSCHFGPFFVC